jgi:hypothetical protein
MGLLPRRMLEAALVLASAVALAATPAAMTFSAEATQADATQAECPAYSVEINVKPSSVSRGRGYDVVAALRDPDTGSRIVTIEAEVRGGQGTRSSRELPAGGGTFSLSMEIGRSESPTTYTLELVRGGRTLLFHRAQIQLTD